MTQVSVEDEHLVRVHFLHFPLNDLLLALQQVHQGELLVDILSGIVTLRAIKHDCVLELESPFGLLCIIQVFDVVMLFEVWSEERLVGLDMGTFTDCSSYFRCVSGIT